MDQCPRHGELRMTTEYSVLRTLPSMAAYAGVDTALCMQACTEYIPLCTSMEYGVLRAPYARSVRWLSVC